LRIACAPSNAARSCWSQPWASSRARCSRSRVARASARAVRSYWSWASACWCDNPPRKIPYYRLRPIHLGH
jgi:hypothetical protein